MLAKPAAKTQAKKTVPIPSLTEISLWEALRP